MKKQQPKNKPSSDWLVVGRFGRVHGVRGLIYLRSYTDPHDNILTYMSWYVRFKTGWQPIQCSQKVWHGERLLVKIRLFEERELAAKLTGLEVGILKSDLPLLPEDEYYWHDLIQLTVCDKAGKILGTVFEIVQTGAHDVLVVTGKKRCLIPIIPEKIILAVDKTAGRITVDWDPDF